MSEPFAADSRARILGYAGCYGFFALLFLLSVVDFLWWRGTTLLLIGRLIENKLIDELAGPFYVALMMLLVGGSLFVLVLFGEPYLRAGVARRETRRRFVRLAVPLAAAFVIGLAVRSVV